jgi:hypothetical protein
VQWHDVGVSLRHLRTLTSGTFRSLRCFDWRLTQYVGLTLCIHAAWTQETTLTKPEISGASRTIYIDKLHYKYALGASSAHQLALAFQRLLQGHALLSHDIILHHAAHAPRGREYIGAAC